MFNRTSVPTPIGGFPYPPDLTGNKPPDGIRSYLTRPAVIKLGFLPLQIEIRRRGTYHVYCNPSPSSLKRISTLADNLTRSGWRTWPNADGWMTIQEVAW